LSGRGSNEDVAMLAAQALIASTCVMLSDVSSLPADFLLNQPVST
jgi:CDP-glycerol glycerophosphotransferase (TagB/SpsB family)